MIPLSATPLDRCQPRSAVWANSSAEQCQPRRAFCCRFGNAVPWGAMKQGSAPPTEEGRTPSRTLSESDSKSLLAGFGIPFASERIVDSPQGAVDAARDLGMPIAAKLCGDNISHKTERGLVRLGLSTDDEVRDAAAGLFAAARAEDDATGVLVAPMISGDRELIAGATTDPQFGPTVLIGIGGVLAEAVADVSIRLAPIAEIDAAEMIEDLQAQALLGEFRGQPAVDRDALVTTLMGLSAAICEGSSEGTPIASIDINPLIISGGSPVAVDALVELATPEATEGE